MAREQYFMYLQCFGLGERRSARIQKLLLVDADLLHVIPQQILHLQKAKQLTSVVLTTDE